MAVTAVTNSFEVITKYLPKATDKYFVGKSKTVMLETGSKYIDVDFKETGYVKIAEFLLDGLSDYYKTQEYTTSRDGGLLPGDGRPTNPADYAAYAGNMGTGERDGFEIGGTTVRWEIFKLQWCRGRQFRIDHISNEETAGVIMGNLVQDFVEYKVIPEVDACRFSVIAGSASKSLGNLLYQTVKAEAGQEGEDGDINENTILSDFFRMRSWMITNEVPMEDMIWYMTPDVYAILVNSEKLVKFITQGDFRSDNGITFKVDKFNGIPIIEVEPSRFFTDILLTNNGFQAQNSSRAINYMLVAKKAIVPIRKLEVNEIYNEREAGIAGYHGKMMNYLIYHGVVIPRNKLTAVVVSVNDAEGSPLGKSTNSLLVDIRKGSNTNAWKLYTYFTRPSGMRGTVVYANEAFTVGSTVNLATVNRVEKDQEVIDATATTHYFALVDFRGRVLAVTDGPVTLIKA